MNCTAQTAPSKRPGGAWIAAARGELVSKNEVVHMRGVFDRKVDGRFH